MTGEEYAKTFKCNDEEPMTQPIYHHKFSPWRVVGEQRIVAAESTWREPIKWGKAAACDCFARGDYGERHLPSCPQLSRPRVFCASLADVFEGWQGQCQMSDGGWCVKHRQWGELTGYGSCALSGGSDAVRLDDVRARLFRTWRATPNLWWLVLTKRIENVRRMLDGRHENLWLGVSIACQDDADRLIPELLKCRDLCAKTFLSVEPLVGQVDLCDLDNGRMQCHWNVLDGSCAQEMYDGGMGIVSRSPHHVDWVIVGGESGPNARPCDVAWVRSIVRQCQAAGVPVFVKQVGSRVRCASVMDVPLGTAMRCPGHEGDPSELYAPILRDKKGGDPSEWPEDIRVREVPQ